MDKNIRVSSKSYKFISAISKKTGISIKYIIEKIADGDINIEGKVRKPYQMLK